MPEEKIPASCVQCKYFHQHFVRSAGNRFVPLEQGHCGNPRLRDKRVNTPACSRFAKRPEKKGDA